MRENIKRAHRSIVAIVAVAIFTVSTATVWGEDYLYETNNGTISITKYIGPGGAVSIPETINGLPVTSIGRAAFDSCTSLTSVTIPNSVTSIEYGAFEYCTSLTSVTIDNAGVVLGGFVFGGCASLPYARIGSGAMLLRRGSCDNTVTIQSTIDGLPVTHLGDGLFGDCTNLTSVMIPNSVTSIGCAFFGCTSLTTVTIPNSVTTIGGGAFHNCTNLTSITIPDSVISIDVQAFWDCISVTNATIGRSVTDIGENAFAGCMSLIAITVDPLNTQYCSVDGVLIDKGRTTLVKFPEGKAGSYTIPNSVTRIEAEAFSFSTRLTQVTIPNSVISIGHVAFANCHGLTSVIVPDSVIEIGGGVFFSCFGLTNASIGNGVTTIQMGGWDWPLGFWEWCTNLTSVTIGNSVTNIDSWSFLFCTALSSVNIPRCVTSIGFRAFVDCTRMVAINVDPMNATFSSLDGVLFNKNKTTLVEYPAGRAGAYIVPGSVTGIKEAAFWCRTNLTGITLSQNLSIIGLDAFYDCTALTSLTIPDSVTSIEAHSFMWCSGLTNVTIGHSVKSIGDAAFEQCTSLTGVYFRANPPASVGYVVFFGTTNATVYYLPGTTGWSSTFSDRPTAPWVLPYPVILTTPPNFGVQTNAFGFRISWATNVSVVVEASTTLVNPVWSPLSTNTLINGWTDFRDAEWKNNPSRFYRVRQH